MPLQFLKGLLQTGSGKISVIVLGFLTLMIITRRLPPDLAGTFMLMQVLAVFLMEASSIGLHMSIPKFMTGAETPEAKHQIIATSALFRFVTIVIVAFIAVLVSEPLAAIFGFTIPDELLIFLPIMVVLESLVKLLTTLMQGSFQFRQIGISHAISSFFHVGYQQS
ncbi:MAG: lipopolysaccharide biosynthesis protein, partial [Aggregatilineales bacterium]